MRFLEYEISSGRIISEIISASTPESDSGIGIIEINDYESIDPLKYIVKDGVITKAYETKAEQLERERLRKEHKENAYLRFKSMMSECFVAIMKRDNDALEQLREEFSALEAYL